MKTRNKGYFGAAALSAVAALWGSSTIAGTLQCPPQPSAAGPTYIELTAPDSITLGCYDYGQSGKGSGQYSVSLGVPVVLDNNILELPANTLERNIGFLLSGTTDAGTTGFFTVLVDQAGPLYLVFKSGGGKNDPYWFAFSLSGFTKNDVLAWTIFGGENALSNTRLFGGTRIPDEPPPPPVPEPGTLALLGLGLVGLGFGRRNRA